MPPPAAESAALRIAPQAAALPGERRVHEAAERSLSGERSGLRAVWPFLGPAFIAAVAYVDPGNFATNLAGGAEFGYMLLWVILAANLMAMLIQTMSAKLGIATGMNLPEVCRSQFPRRVDGRALGAGRAGRHGHRPGRVHRRRARAEPALRHPARLGRRCSPASSRSASWPCRREADSATSRP